MLDAPKLAPPAPVKRKDFIFSISAHSRAFSSIMLRITTFWKSPGVASLGGLSLASSDASSGSLGNEVGLRAFKAASLLAKSDQNGFVATSGVPLPPAFAVSSMAFWPLSGVFSSSALMATPLGS